FNGDGAPGQLWVFWLAPLVGGLIGGLIYPLLFERGKAAHAEAPRAAK
ncbi:MAG TPA: aquaporin, partial [Mycobacterium sp.]|nr:aquaporin [Mycobacterium sp.]